MCVCVYVSFFSTVLWSTIKTIIHSPILHLFHQKPITTPAAAFLKDKVRLAYSQEIILFKIKNVFIIKFQVVFISIVS